MTILQCYGTPLSLSLLFASQKVITFSFSNGESNEGIYGDEEDGEKGRPEAKMTDVMFH